MPKLPTWRDIRRFCEIDGWEEKTTSRGGTPDHYRFRKRLPDGRNLTTKASHGSGGIEDPGLWARIWKDQLALEGEQDFWDCLASGCPIERDVSPMATPPSADRLDYGLVRRLEAVLGVPPHEAVRLTREEAVRRLREAQGDTP